MSERPGIAGIHALLRDPAFRAGLALRIALVVLLVPETQSQWFLDFLGHTIQHPGVDPWSTHLAAGGTPLAYPYGPAMLLAHLPFALAGFWVDQLAGSTYFLGVGFRCALLTADVATLVLLERLLPGQTRRLIGLYWWSPIALFVTYWNGQTDVVPVALLLLALERLRAGGARSSGVALGAACAAKLSMGLAVPFAGIYLWRNKRLRNLLGPFAGGLFLAGAVLFVPWLASPGFRTMVLGSRELGRALDLSLPLGSTLRLYLVPTLYLLSAYAVWRLRRVSFDLLLAIMGLSFFLVVLGTPAPPGWYLWLLPFMVAHQLRSDPSATLLSGGFSLLVVGVHLLTSTGAGAPLFTNAPLLPRDALGLASSPRALSLAMTGVVATGLVIIVQMLRERVAKNDHFRIAQKPLIVGIAGDSGSGKDTLSRALADLFGSHSVVHVSGDDYHRWDRESPMWQTLTHLDPRANDLHRFSEDVMSLMDGRRIVCRRYDHGTGRFLAPTLLEKNDVIIASGLHALRSRRLQRLFDVAVYLDPDEDLRLRWKFARDAGERGRTIEETQRESERRRADAAKHIKPQQQAADLRLRLVPALPRDATPVQAGERLTLIATLRSCDYHEPLTRALTDLCGARVEVELADDSDETTLTIEGTPSAADIARAASILAPGIAELLDRPPRWSDGCTGVMQLLVLLEAEASLRARIL